MISKELNNLIKRDYKLIEKNCLICSNIDLNPIIPNDDNNIISINYNNNNYSINNIIKDINNNTFINLYDYITQKNAIIFIMRNVGSNLIKKNACFANIL